MKIQTNTWPISNDGRLKLNKTIDSVHQENQEAERKKWNDILHRLFDFTMFSAKQNLPFRGPAFCQSRKEKC